MNLTFDKPKATQTAAAFLRLAGGQLQIHALVRLLYRVDREALRRLGMPITTDRYAAYNFGPATRGIYDLIQASGNPEADPTYWSRHILNFGPSTVTISSDPGDSEMSPAELRLIAELFDSHGQRDCTVEEIRRDFPEWNDPSEGSHPIEISEILAALHLSEDEVFHIEDAISAQRAASGFAIHPR